MYVLWATIIFIVVVSIDLFAGGLAYGAYKVRISFLKALIINLVGKVTIGTALLSGYAFGQLVPEIVGIILCFVILTSLGIFKIVQQIVASKHEKPLKNISWWHCVLLGLALSMDGVGMAFGTTVATMPFYFIPIVLGALLVTDQVVVQSSNALGLYLAKKERVKSVNLNIIAGVLLITVATTKLILELTGVL